MSTFIDDCVSGEAQPDDINNYIDKWHDANTDEELHEFLGMEEDEYMSWLEDSNVLEDIIAKYKD